MSYMDNWEQRDSKTGRNKFDWIYVNTWEWKLFYMKLLWRELIQSVNDNQSSKDSEWQKLS